MSAGELLFGGLLAVNAAAFFLYGLDKWKAVHGRRRIREMTLLLIAAAGGSAGAFLAMRFFAIRHAMLYFNSACPSSFFCRQLSLFSFGNSSGGLDYIHDYLYNTKDTKSCDEDGLRKRPAERAFGR